MALIRSIKNTESNWP